MTPFQSLYLDWALIAFWPIAGKAAFAFADPLLFGEASLLLGLILLTPYLCRRGRWRQLFLPEHRVSLFVLGAAGSGLSIFLQLKAVSLTTPTNAAIVCQIEAVYSIGLASWILRERITMWQIAATLLVLGGTGLILWRDADTLHWKGDLILLFTPWLFQISNICGKRLPASLEPATIASARIFYGAAVLAPFAAWSLASGPVHFSFAAPALGLLAFHALVLNCLNITLWYNAIRNLELSKCTAVILSYPALTMMYSWALGLEPLSMGQLAGLALSMSGSIWLTIQMRKSAQENAYD